MAQEIWTPTCHIRYHFNILEQLWEMRRNSVELVQQWREVPNVMDAGIASKSTKINFDVEDALHEDDDPVDQAFRPD